ncbi:hypothetical protein EYF80_017858 [Liparis tanakae]|uniref:Uncharacterized protein n=1 Tax=Liparis tanakae TaxID=230148 RepID=A0A4Z2I251_9TELE|nr:hypothetical protein EYF80_017858 [Liparis tanakae]
MKEVAGGVRVIDFGLKGLKSRPRSRRIFPTAARGASVTSGASDGRSHFLSKKVSLEGNTLLGCHAPTGRTGTMPGKEGKWFEEEAR